MPPKLRTLCLAPNGACPGMTLAKPAYDLSGSVLLGPGTVLDAAMIERLVRRGIEAISVSIPDERDDEAVAHELAAVNDRIARIFRGPSNPAREALRAAILEYRIETTQ